MLNCFTDDNYVIVKTGDPNVDFNVFVGKSADDGNAVFLWDGITDYED